MRIESALYSGREGLNSHGQAISVIGDNIANFNTMGYKTSRPEFSDLLPAGGFGDTNPETMPSGNGATLGRVRQIFDDGTAEATGRPLDAAIQGGGFFIVGDTANQKYTRAGSFSISDGGLLVDADGANVLGFAPGSTTLGTINMFGVSTNATPTTKIQIFGNLDSQDAVKTAAPSNPTSFKQVIDGASYTSTTSAVDSLGKEHDFTLAFTRTGASTWIAQAYIDGADVGGTAGVPVQVGGNATMNFNTSGGIDAANTAAAIITATPAYGGGAAAGNFTIDLSKYSQFAGTSITSSVTKDGKASGQVANYEIDNDGQVNAVMSTGDTVTIASLGLANFPNVDGLIRSGKNAFQAGASTGTVKTSSAGQNGMGKIVGSSLERSTVDIANQFSDLVLFQRGYQANSQTLNTANSIIKDTIGLMR